MKSPLSKNLIVREDRHKATFNVYKKDLKLSKEVKILFNIKSDSISLNDFLELFTDESKRKFIAAWDQTKELKKVNFQVSNLSYTNTYSVHLNWDNKSNNFSECWITLEDQVDTTIRPKEFSVTDSIFEMSLALQHNIRNPISSLTMLHDIMKTSDGKIKMSWLDAMGQLLETTDRMLNQNLDLISKLQRLEQKFDFKETISLKDILVGILEQFKFNMEEHNATITVDVPDTIKIHTSTSILENILHNLISNAIKYRKMESKIPLQVAITARSNQNFTEIEISDNGIGMDLELYGDKLFQINRTFSNRPNSRGLGLYLVKTQLERLGGTIECNSELNIGTSFIISHPKN